MDNRSRKALLIIGLLVTAQSTSTVYASTAPLTVQHLFAAGSIAALVLWTTAVFRGSPEMLKVPGGILFALVAASFWLRFGPLRAMMAVVLIVVYALVLTVLYRSDPPRSNGDDNRQ